MREEDIEKAMQPFQQIDNSLARQYEGTGLGLTLTKLLTELHFPDSPIQSATFLRDGSRIRTRQANYSYRIWDVFTGQPLTEGPSWRPGSFRRFLLGQLPDGRDEWLEFWRTNHLLPPFAELYGRRRGRLVPRDRPGAGIEDRHEVLEERLLEPERERERCAALRISATGVPPRFGRCDQREERPPVDPLLACRLGGFAQKSWFSPAKISETESSVKIRRIESARVCAVES